MPPATGASRVRYAVALALVLSTAAAAAQTSPTAPVHPSMPWGGITTPLGQFIRFVYMPPQPVTLEYLVTDPPASSPVAPSPPDAEAPPPPAEAGRPAPGAAPGAEGEATRGEAGPPEEPVREPSPPAPRIVRQQVTIPGYYVRETTVGFHYPERWVIEQAGPNAYRWRKLPQQFVPK